MVKRNALILALTWTVIVALGMGVALRQMRKGTLELARTQASRSFERDVLFRHWIAKHGGVYVPRTEETPPIPHLAHIEDRDLTTTSGLELTLVNPAYVTRRVHELAQEQYGLQSHITSLHPLRTENAPDQWETDALRAFHRGEIEIVELAKIGDAEYLRLMRPLITEEGCMKCHAHQGYTVGDIRGGISVSVPMAPMWAIMNTQIHVVMLGFALVWLLTLGGIGFGASLIERHLRERDRAMEALRESTAHLRSLIETIPDLVWLKAPDGVYMACNLKFGLFFGATETEIVGKTDYDFVDKVLADFFREKDKAAIAAGGPCMNEEEVTYADDGHREFLETLRTPMFDCEGRLVGVLGVGRDITERQQTQAELENHQKNLEYLVQERTKQLHARVAEADELNSAMVNVMEDLRTINEKLEATGRELAARNKDLNAFSYTVSHDLRAPLRHIAGFTNLLGSREKERLDTTSRRYLETIANSSYRMTRLIDDLLAFSRTGRGKPHFQHVDSNEVVNEALNELSSMTEGRNITWVISDLPAVEADSGLLLQVWQNLIGNAIKFTSRSDEAQIEIGVLAAGAAHGETVFFVRDNGVGFDPRYSDKLFGVFQRLHDHDQFEGTGIGLATVHRILDRHGGRVWAEGELDQGATFFFTLESEQGNQTRKDDRYGHETDSIDCR